MFFKDCILLLIFNYVYIVVVFKFLIEKIELGFEFNISCIACCFLLWGLMYICSFLYVYIYINNWILLEINFKVFRGKWKKFKIMGVRDIYEVDSKMIEKYI